MNFTCFYAIILSEKTKIMLWKKPWALTGKIKNLFGIIEKIKSDCNECPFDDDIIERDLDSMYYQDKYLWSMSDLPGPLARIYAIYQRTSGDDNYFTKFNLIESFFLELIFINISIMLWALRQDMKIYNKNSGLIHSSVKNFQAVWFWDLINLWRTLSKIFRRDIYNKDMQGKLLKLFKVSELSFIEEITEKNIYVNVEKISIYRNKLKWHSWKTDNKLYWGIIKDVEKIFFDTIELISYFRSVELISWSDFNEEKGFYTWDIVFFKWFIFPYLVKHYKLNQILSKWRVYMIERDWDDPMLLADLIKFDISKDEQHYISYFYNRVEWKRLRYVTYESSVWDKYYLFWDVDEELVC